MPRIDWPELFLSSTGRLGRAPFVLCIAVLIAFAAAEWVWLARSMASPVAFVVNCALLFSAAWLLSKRLHDRGRAGWWAALVLWAWLALWPAPSTWVEWAFAPILAVAIVDLVLLPGKAAANRFGPVSGR